MADREERISRRRFLTMLGASAAFAAGTGCSRGDRGVIIPRTKRHRGDPATGVPGIADHYASTFDEGLNAYGVLVKTRESRPIHIEGNDKHPFSNGKTSPRALADVLRLYDPDRMKRPLLDGKPTTWENAEERLHAALHAAKRAREPVLLLTGAVISPTRRTLIGEFQKALPGLRHIAWEPTAHDTAALRRCFAAPRAHRPRLDRADVIVAFEADLLAGDDPEALAAFAARRDPGHPNAMNRLYVFEGGVSLTGAAADHRFMLRPSKAAALAFAVARTLHEDLGRALPPGLAPADLTPFDLKTLAQEHGLRTDLLRALAGDLHAAGTRGLVLPGAALPWEAHAACHLLNAMLGAEGHSLDSAFAPDLADLAGTDEMRALLESMAAGKFAAAVFWGANPAYAYPDAVLWKSAAKGVPFTTSIGLHTDETAQACRAALPENHWLESWGDFAPTADILNLRQPAVGPLYETRQGEDVLLGALRALGRDVPADYHHYLMDRWRREIHPGASAVPFTRFWQAALHDGFLRRRIEPAPPRRLRAKAVRDAARRADAARTAPDFELLLVPGAGVFDGRYANNGWLQELPDPISKQTWGNAAAVSEKDAARLGVKEGDLLRLEAGGRAAVLPVLIQPGQTPGVLSAALGHGRRSGSVARGIGENIFPLLGADVRVAPAGGRVSLARTQLHHRMEGRDIVRTYPTAEHARRSHDGARGHEHPSLYKEQNFPEHKWGMSVDLSACVGCNGCVIACQSENNIPVVGPEQIKKGREMHWIRIDRYYAGSPDAPRTVHQPMLCQHCDNAPCENVCPVNATTHSPDGLNQMTYNRCVGTRYCANNCPYKVRRFNFFEWTAGKTESERLAFNPEVTVRPRGVMEKCTFCVQRIQDGRQKAKAEKRALRDGEITPACAAACAAGAIVFGDLKRPDSRVSRRSLNGRGYKVLEELGVRPAITYLADLSNPAAGPEAHGS